MFKRIVSGILWFLKLNSFLQTLEAEVVRVGVDGKLVEGRTHHFWLERCKRVSPTSLHVHLQLQQDLQRVGHLRLAVGGGRDNQ